MTLVYQQLSDIGRVINDTEVAELLLSGLDKEFDVLVSRLETAGLSSNLTSEMVRAHLLQEELRRSGTNSGTNGLSDASLFTNRMKNKKLICSYCQKEGHKKSRCYKLKNEKKKQQGNNNNAYTMLASALLATGPNDYVVDSGCSSHMVKC